MTTKETGSRCKNYTKEWVDKVVSDTFNELLVGISSKPQLHPSEEANRDDALAEYSSTKIYEFINGYHAYCKLCEQHFYSRSVSTDINSFFQKHLNTSYHKQIRSVCPPSEGDPMFTWQEKFQTGKCNVCEMPDLNSYVLDTAFDLRKLMKLHICFWDQENRETNERILRKYNLLKKFCGLKIFQEKYIRTINGRGVCLLCMTKLPWSGEKAICHLSSDSHYQNFCVFLRACFNFLPKDVLNGFNLEVITRWLITHDPPPVTKFADFNERQLCFQLSNGGDNPYLEERNNFSFSPKLFEKYPVDEDSDFIFNEECLICNERLVPGHMTSERHRTKVANLDKSSFDVPEKFVIFCRNREKRIRMCENYKKLKNGLDSPRLLYSPKNDVKRPPQAPPQTPPASQTSQSQDNYFKSLLKKKLDLITYIFTVPKSGEIYCHMCDQNLSSNQEMMHLTSSYHVSQESKWNELKNLFDNERFVEVFQKVKNLILCLVCGAVFDSNNFIPHLKGGTHIRRFEWYCSQDSTPISSTFLFKGDFSCYCTLCNTPMNTRISISSIKTALKNIRYHWPCLKNKPDLSAELQTILDDNNKSVVENNQKKLPEKSVPCSTCGQSFKKTDLKVHSETCEKNSVDFKKVEKTLEDFVYVFEKKIMYNVLNKSAVLLSRLNRLSVGDTKNEIKKVLLDEQPPTGHGKSSEGCNESSTESCSGEQNSEEQVEEKYAKLLKNELIAQKTDNCIKKEGILPFKNFEEDDFDDEHEVLVIEGLPKNKRRCEVIYSKFNSFVKIRYVFFSKKKAILAFTDSSPAEVAPKVYDLFKEHDLLLTISTRKEHEKDVEKPPSLDKNLLVLLQNPQALMDFSLNLIVQAIAMTESPLERKREELVCSTIISAVMESFPQGRCYPFGSRLSGLTLDNSDLDVFLDCGGMYEGFKNTTPLSERKLVNKVAGLLRRKKEIAEITVVDRARVPIVSFLHKPTFMRCDLSFKNGLSVQNTLLIKFLLTLDWRVRPLILFLKHWAKLNGLHGPPYFSSYAIAMLVINYLEQLEHPVLPTIESLQNSYIGWDCSINVNKSTLPSSDNKDPLPKLITELFEFYSNFDYETNVISPLTGTPVPREAFTCTGGDKLPMCYKRNVLNIPPPIENLVNNKIHICIVDPLDVSHVLTKSFTSRGLQVFIHLCKKSAELLRKAITVPRLEQQ